MNEKEINSTDESASTEEDDKKEKKVSRFYKTATILLSVFLVLFCALFLSIRYLEQKSIKDAVIVTHAVAAESTVDNKVGRININTASVDELTALTGIGEGRAKAIIEYRNEYGNFASIEEIKNVSGIGDSIFSQIKDSICVNE